METSPVRVPSRAHSVSLSNPPCSSSSSPRQTPTSYADSRRFSNKAPRQSSETAIVSIYSMYGDERRSSWAASRALSADLSGKDIVPQVTLALPEDNLNGDIDSELAYFSDRPPTADLTPSPKTRFTSYAASETKRRASSTNTALRSSDMTHLSLPSQSEDSSTSSRPSSTSKRRSAILDEHESGDTLSPHSNSFLSSPERVTSPSPSSRSSPGTPTSLPLKHEVETVLASKTSLAPTEGEDLDAFHVRNTYALLEMSGVKGDGYQDGVERTRARIGASRASQMNAENALGDGTEKTRDLNQEEIETLATVDRYGFFYTPSHDRLILIPTAPLLKRLSRVTAGPPNASTSAATLKALPAAQLPIREVTRIGKWNRMLEAEQRDEGANIQGWRVKPAKYSKLSERTYKGIPDRWRSAAWDLLLRQFSRTENVETIRLGQEYRECLERPSTYDIQIDLDVPRTIGGHIMFKTRYGAGQRSLFHVLHSFSLRCSQCGYVQGMGPIAATLLCYFDPERVYASLVRLHDSYQLHNIFSPGFPGLLEAIYVQERITEQMMPAVYAAFKKHMISTTSYATKWYITLFANSVPFQTQLRLWDVFLLEGQDLFVAVAVSIIWAYRDHITAANANFETVLSLLSSFFVPEDENVLLFWIEKTLGDRRLRASISDWRREWQRLVAEGKDGSALL